MLTKCQFYLIMNFNGKNHHQPSLLKLRAPAKKLSKLVLQAFFYRSLRLRPLGWVAYFHMCAQMCAYMCAQSSRSPKFWENLSGMTVRNIFFSEKTIFLVSRWNFYFVFSCEGKMSGQIIRYWQNCTGNCDSRCKSLDQIV